MSGAVTVRFLPQDEAASVPAATDLLTAAHWQGIVVDSICGGAGTCGRCRVLIEEGSGEVSAADQWLLSVAELRQGWRLACTTPARQASVVRVPEVRQMPHTALTGAGKPVAVEPVVRKLSLRLDAPREGDTRADLERVRQGLAAEGYGLLEDESLLEWLPTRLREAQFAGTATLVEQRLVDFEAGDTRGALHGVAFDLGTTTVVGSLLDLVTGEVLAVESALNRQMIFGGDVISRIAHGMRGESQRQDLQRTAIETLNRILRRLARSVGIDPRSVPLALVVGNSTMLHLLLGVESRSLALAPFVPVFQRSVTVPAGSLDLEIHPRGSLETFPLIGAYVGADIVAGLHATGLAQQDRPWLFIDVGTNSEMALGSTGAVAATSAPAGPAFEGGCIRAGMTAVAGAVDRVVLGEELELSVIGGGEVRGLCGSGLIDLAAGLLKIGLLSADGRLRSSQEAGDHPLAHRLVEVDGERAFTVTPEVHLTQRDIRELQAAKSSVSTGVEVLMAHLGVDASDLERVLLAGSFGSSLDPHSARAIGLVPDLPVEKIHFVGNVAAEGAKMALLSFRERRMAYDLADSVEYVELSTRADFNELFVRGVSFPEARKRGRL